jgi:hypothetical protein
MKALSRILILIFWGLLSRTGAGQGAGETFPLLFRSTTFDFGNMGELSGPVYHAFEFENQGTDTVWIISAAAGCHCTTGDFPRQAILPGKKGFIRVSYDPKGRPWPFHSAVEIRLKDKPLTRKLEISGNTIGGKETPRFSPVEFTQRFQYNEKSIEAEEAGFRAFVAGLAPLIEKHRFIEIQIESSASEVPTKTYSSNQELTEVRAREAREKIMEILKNLHADLERIRFRSDITRVQGPAYSRDFQKQLAKYQPFQYVKIQVF